MSSRTRKDLVCDRCGYSLRELVAKSYGSIDRMDIRAQRALARRVGWRTKFNKGMDYCSGCWPDVKKQILGYYRSPNNH